MKLPLWKQREREREKGRDEGIMASSLYDQTSSNDLSFYIIYSDQ